jgi:hypothetical protein
VLVADLAVQGQCFLAGGEGFLEPPEILAGLADVGQADA